MKQVKKVAVVPSAAALMINARNEPERDSKKVENIKAQEDVIEPCQDHGTQVDGEGAGRQCGDFGHLHFWRLYRRWQGYEGLAIRDR